ncbi:hypothetical protein Z043_125427, partial [Scleropages formosus]
PQQIRTGTKGGTEDMWRTSGGRVNARPSEARFDRLSTDAQDKVSYTRPRLRPSRAGKRRDTRAKQHKDERRERSLGRAPRRPSGTVKRAFPAALPGLSGDGSAARTFPGLDEPQSLSKPMDLRFSAGDRLLVLHKSSPHWCWAELHGLSGYVPSNHLQARAQQQLYAVEASTMVVHTRRLVQENGCEALVTVIHSRAGDLVLPEKVDVLVSDWMGNCLLFEFMVESVLVARDRWLEEGGTMWPSSASLVLVPCEALAEYEEKVSFWKCPYGLDFSCLQPIAQREFFSKPKFNHESKPEDCLSAPCDVITLDMHTVQVADLEKMTGEFKFGVENQGTLHGFTAWFSARFRSLETGGTPAELNTGPHSK